MTLTAGLRVIARDPRFFEPLFVAIALALAAEHVAPGALVSYVGLAALATAFVAWAVARLQPLSAHVPAAQGRRGRPPAGGALARQPLLALVAGFVVVAAAAGLAVLVTPVFSARVVGWDGALVAATVLGPAVGASLWWDRVGRYAARVRAASRRGGGRGVRSA